MSVQSCWGDSLSGAPDLVRVRQRHRRRRGHDHWSLANAAPLGSAALAGTTYPIDRELTCQLLGFDAVGGNSLDNVSDRDFAIEFFAPPPAWR